ncbi:MAG: cupredoxin domain-containing protein [Armatimonadetes bacterium]|nr:cupredoxin domain-containing protein [Armatimonadota bacterium]
MKNQTTILTLAVAFAIAAQTFAVTSAIQGGSPKADGPAVAKMVKGVQAITVTIDNGKYSPAVIEVAKGKPVEITFKGGQNMGCGSTVEFKSLKLKKTVDAGKSVVVKFTPNKVGEIKFTCSMNMYQGKVIVK